MITGTSIFLGQFLSSRPWISFLDHPLSLQGVEPLHLSLSQLHPSPPPTIMPTSSRPQEPQATPQPSALCLLLTICSNTTQRVVCGPATSASRGVKTLTYKPCARGPATCGFRSPPGDSDAPNLRNHRCGTEVAAGNSGDSSFCTVV